MTFFKKRKNLAVSALLLILSAACNKNDLAPRSPADYYISKNGAVVSPAIGSAYEIIIPPDALGENQYILEKINDNTQQLVLDSTFSFGVISESVCFATYNCDSLLIPGVINLSINSKYSAFSQSQQSRAFCIDNDTDIKDITNWREIASGIAFNGQRSIQFTDLKKTYFLGWTSN